MKLSVYIPVLKRDGLYERCRASIERSIEFARREGTSLPPDEFEIVAVEGVSPLAEARNEGVRRTTGDWIATVDADDEVTEDWFAEIVRAIGRAEAGSEAVDDIVFDMTFVRGSRENVTVYGRKTIVDGKTLVEDVLRDVRIGSHTPRHVMNRRLFAGVNYERVPVLEDYVTMPRLMARVRNALYVAKPLYRYIIRENSLSTGTNGLTILDIAKRRHAEYGRPAEISGCLLAYNCLYDCADAAGEARRWIRRHLRAALTDGEVPVKWKLKFVLASLGIMIRRPK